MRYQIYFNFQPRDGHLFWKLAAVLSLLLLFGLTLLPTAIKPINISNADKIFHFIAFAGVTYLLLYALPGVKKINLLVFMVTLGFAIELVQYNIPGRDFSWLDALADSLGVVFILLLFRRSHKTTRLTTLEQFG